MFTLQFAGLAGLALACAPVMAQGQHDAASAPREVAANERGAEGALQLRPARRLAPSQLVRDLGTMSPSKAFDMPVVAGPLELTVAVQLAVGRHPSIGDAIATLLQHEGGVDVARAGYYPQVRVGVGGSRSNGAATARSGTQASISASQMLYDFGKVSGAVKQSEAQVLRQQAMVLKQLDAVALEAAQAVVQVHRYQTLLDIAKDQVQAVEKVMETAQLRASAGISTQSDPIQAESRVDSARANRLQVQTQLAQWRERLRTLLGGAVPQVIDPLPDQLARSISMDIVPDDGLLPDVLVARAERQAATAQIDIARAQRYPTLSLDASANKAMAGTNANSNAPERGLNHSIALNLSSVLYQGGALDAQVRSAIAAEEAAGQRVETARLRAGDQARSFREQIIGAQARLGALASRKRTIAIARDLYREQYKLGTRSILDLLNAEQEIYQAAAEEEAVQHDLWDQRIAYIGATGQTREVYGLNNQTIQGMDVRP